MANVDILLELLLRQKSHMRRRLKGLQIEMMSCDFIPFVWAKDRVPFTSIFFIEPYRLLYSRIIYYRNDLLPSLMS